jgi:hypothetical protein
MKRRLMVMAMIAGCWTMALAIESTDTLPGRDFWAGCFAATAFALVYKSQCLGVSRYFQGVRQRILAAETAHTTAVPAAVPATVAQPLAPAAMSASRIAMEMTTSGRRRTAAPLGVACAS